MSLLEAALPHADAGTPSPERPADAPDAARDDAPEATPPAAEARPAAEPLPDGAESPDGFKAFDDLDRVTIMLLYYQTVTLEQIEAAWESWKQQDRQEALWRVLARHPELDREHLYAEAARIYAFKEAEVARDEALRYLRGIRTRFTDDQWEQMRALRVLPVAQEPEPHGRPPRMILAAYDPSGPDVRRLLKHLHLEHHELRYLPESVLAELVAEAFPQKNEYLERISEGAVAVDLGTSYEAAAGLVDEDALEAEISRSSVINLFEATLVEAVRQGASDIHIWPNAERQIEIHLRKDGELRRWHREARLHPEAFLAVVKDNADNVDRFERDAAQDGFMQRRIDGALIRFRVSVLPIASANQEMRPESIVIRVLDDRKVVSDLRSLGLSDLALRRFNEAIRQPHGMVILTGPTGSGKSTTLYAALHQVVTPKVNVLTVEDPVEYVIPGVRQIKLSHKLGLEQALRAILRHDPDIVMVGEMRDRPTAELAIKLANTGHLTFSTLHTNDAPSAVSRLYKLGIEPFLLAYAINLVVAQRLIRTLCPACKQVDERPDKLLLAWLGFTRQETADATFYVPGHDERCATCHGTGYKGRRAIAEALPFSGAIRRIILEAGSAVAEDRIREQARQEGLPTLRDAARVLVRQGETSVAEMMRVVATQD